MKLKMATARFMPSPGSKDRDLLQGPFLLSVQCGLAEKSFLTLTNCPPIRRADWKTRIVCLIPLAFADQSREDATTLGQ
jgi:hypothetical protein